MKFEEDPNLIRDLKIKFLHNHTRFKIFAN